MRLIQRIYSAKVIIAMYVTLLIILSVIMGDMLIRKTYNYSAKSRYKKIIKKYDKTNSLDFGKYVNDLAGDKTLKKYRNISFGLFGRNDGTYMLDDIDGWMIRFQIAEDYDYYILRIRGYDGDKNRFKIPVIEMCNLVRKYGIVYFDTNKRMNSYPAFKVYFDTRIIKDDTLPKYETKIDILDKKKKPLYVQGVLIYINDEKEYQKSEEYLEDKPIRINDKVYYMSRYAYSVRFVSKYQE
ncbi:MAG: hypothetical protein CVV21_03625 [Candidatus Goldiibacteriota bacterium HGW-Goldbacteria-1]|jgi:hypothetical protein|nr:MAG: hypothetical protein CVV21_03625 [Candidatus Goldiibacteriota bacterium HGW-Goldbacteria-1]